MEDLRIIDLTSKKEASEKDIGSQGYMYYELSNKNILVPQAFVLTIEAFDEFIQLNGFVDFIIESLSETTKNPKKIPKYSKFIQREIMKGDLDSNLRSAIASVYKRFSGFGKTAVKVQASLTSKELADSMKNPAFENDAIFGLENIIMSIKEVWASLFSEQAMLYRENIQYEGPLTLAVLISKDPVSEVSGIAHSMMPLRDSNELEIEVILGGISPLLNGSLNGDRYVCNLATGEVVEKNIVGQKWMLVNKFEKGIFRQKKLEISDIWKNRAKLSDNQIGKIITIAQTLINKYKQSIDIYLAIELGKVIVTDVEIVDDTRELLLNKGQSSNFEELRAKLEYGPELEIEPELNDQLRPSLESKKSMNDYVEEVKNLMETKVSEEEVKEGLVDKVDVEQAIEEVKQVPEEVSQAQQDQIKTITEVYSTDFNAELYRANEKNINGVLSLSGDKFVGSKDYKELLKNKKETVGELMKYIASVANEVHKPVIYKFASDCYKKDGKGFGVSRILQTGTLFDIELEAVKNIRNKLGLRNVWVSVPFLRNSEEFIEIKKVIFLNSLRRSSSFKVFADIDNTASILAVKDIVESGVDGLIFDLDELAKNVFISSDNSYISSKVLGELVKIGMKQSADTRAKSIIVGDIINTLGLKDLINQGATGVGIKLEKVTETKEYLVKVETRKLKKLS